MMMTLSPARYDLTYWPVINNINTLIFVNESEKIILILFRGMREKEKYKTNKKL